VNSRTDTRAINPSSRLRSINASFSASQFTQLQITLIISHVIAYRAVYALFHILFYFYIVVYYLFLMSYMYAVSCQSLSMYVVNDSIIAAFLLLLRSW